MKRPQPLRRLQGAQGTSHRTVVQHGCYTRNKSRQKKRRVQGVCFATMRHAPCAQVCGFILESKEQSCNHDASMVNTERSVRVNTHGMVGLNYSGFLFAIFPTCVLKEPMPHCSWLPTQSASAVHVRSAVLALLHVRPEMTVSHCTVTVFAR